MPKSNDQISAALGDEQTSLHLEPAGSPDHSCDLRERTPDPHRASSNHDYAFDIWLSGISAAILVMVVAVLYYSLFVIIVPSANMLSLGTSSLVPVQ